MNIEQRLAESSGPSTPTPCRPVTLNVDLDVALTVLARRRLRRPPPPARPGYPTATPDTLQRRFLSTPEPSPPRRHHHRPPRPPHLLTDPAASRHPHRHHHPLVGKPTPPLPAQLARGTIRCTENRASRVPSPEDPHHVPVESPATDGQADSTITGNLCASTRGPRRNPQPPESPVSGSAGRVQRRVLHSVNPTWSCDRRCAGASSGNSRPEMAGQPGRRPRVRPVARTRSSRTASRVPAMRGPRGTARGRAPHGPRGPRN